LRRCGNPQSAAADRDARLGGLQATLPSQSPGHRGRNLERRQVRRWEGFMNSGKTQSAEEAPGGPAQEVGMGEVLDHVRSPEELKRPHVVEFRGVTKTYNAGQPNEFTAIRDVTFVVEDLVDKGEVVSVLGPSGWGKSTILRLIAGLAPQHPPTQGEVLVQGRPVRGPGADRGMVFQDYTSFDNRTVLDNVTFGLECLG